MKKVENNNCLFVTSIRIVLKYSNSGLNLYFCISNLRMQAEQLKSQNNINYDCSSLWFLEYKFGTDVWRGWRGEEG